MQVLVLCMQGRLQRMYTYTMYMWQGANLVFHIREDRMVTNLNKDSTVSGQGGSCHTAFHTAID